MMISKMKSDYYPATRTYEASSRQFHQELRPAEFKRASTMKNAAHFFSFWRRSMNSLTTVEWIFSKFCVCMFYSLFSCFVKSNFCLFLEKLENFFAFLPTMQSVFLHGPKTQWLSLYLVQGILATRSTTFKTLENKPLLASIKANKKFSNSLNAEFFTRAPENSIDFCWIFHLFWNLPC